MRIISKINYMIKFLPRCDTETDEVNLRMLEYRKWEPDTPQGSLIGWLLPVVLSRTGFPIEGPVSLLLVLFPMEPEQKDNTTSKLYGIIRRCWFDHRPTRQVASPVRFMDYVVDFKLPALKTKSIWLQCSFLSSRQTR